MISATVASSSSSACADAARGSKSCRSRRSPPASIDTPSTSRMLPRIEPTSEALTTSCSPAPSANSAMISSGALPKVTLRNPPIPGPDRAASSSVARPINAAVGITPSAEARNTHVAPAWVELQHHRHRDQRHQQVRPPLPGEQEVPATGTVWSRMPVLVSRTADIEGLLTRSAEDRGGTGATLRWAPHGRPFGGWGARSD